MPVTTKVLSTRLTEIHEQYLQGVFNEVEYAERIRSINEQVKPEAWKRYQDALTYTNYMRARGFYASEAAFEFSRLTAWQQYLDAPLEQPLS